MKLTNSLNKWKNVNWLKIGPVFAQCIFSSFSLALNDEEGHFIWPGEFILISKTLARSVKVITFC